MSRYKTGRREDTDTTRRRNVPGWSGLRGRTRIKAGANAWRKVERVMGDIHICPKLKGKVLRSCVTPACLYGLETIAMTENKR